MASYVPSSAGLPPPMNPELIPVDSIGQWAARHEVNAKYLPRLESLRNYQIVLLCDDSGSMDSIADPDTESTITRWGELKMYTNQLMQLCQVLGIPFTVAFLNRCGVEGARGPMDALHLFDESPGGYTPTLRALKTIFSQVTEKPVIIYVLTDGFPTNERGDNNETELEQWLAARPHMDTSFISFILCTDDEDVDRLYRRLEWRRPGIGGWKGREAGIRGIDMTEDYRGELRDIRAAQRNPYYPFSQGDYIVKTVVGAIDVTVHMLDVPTGYSIYSDMRGGEEGVLGVRVGGMSSGTGGASSTSANNAGARSDCCCIIL